MLFVSYHMELDLSTVKLIEKWSLKFLRVMGLERLDNLSTD